MTLLTRGAREYRSSGPIPIVTSTAWAATTAFAVNQFIYSGAKVYIVVKAGTTGSSAPTSTSLAITDGTAVLAFVGYRAPIAYANSLAVATDQLVCANGKVFKVAAGGTTSSSGAGPSVAGASIADGTATFTYVGEQAQPIVTLASSVTSGLTKQVDWNATTKMSILGGSLVQVTGNSRGWLGTASSDGLSYSNSNILGCAASYWTVSDAPLLAFSTYGGGYAVVWVDGQLVAAVPFTTTTENDVHLDFSGCPSPRAERTLRFIVPYTVQLFGLYATATDSFAAYRSPDAIRAVHVADSFGEAGSAGIDAFGYAARLGRALGIDDYRVSAVGGTGILQPQSPRVNFTDRWTQDVISQAPDLVILQNSENDAPFSSTVNAAQQALITRVKNELPSALIVIMGQWNNRGALGSPYNTMNSDAAALALANGIPFVDWSDFSTDGGYIGAAAGTGNSQFYTTWDGVHPTFSGHAFRAERLLPQFAAAWQSILAA